MKKSIKCGKKLISAAVILAMTASCFIFPAGVSASNYLDIAAPRTASGYKAVNCNTSGVNSSKGLKKGTKNLLDVLGIDEETYLKWLDDHDADGKNKNYYIGTPYSPFNASGGDFRNPKGDLSMQYGHPALSGVCKTKGAMTCMGFVWHVLYSSCKNNGGHFTSCGAPDCSRKNCQYITSTGAMIPDMSYYSIKALGKAGGSYDYKHPAYWYDFYRQYDIERYYFKDKKTMYNSGILEKGDIIRQYISGDESQGKGQDHIGIFYGDSPNDDKYWHSCYITGKNSMNGNDITPIKATYNIKLYVVLKVIKSEKPAPSSVSLSREKATRGVGDSYQLTAKIPSGTATTFKWSSSDPDTVSVDKNGLITPLKPGTATITVKTHNELSADCKVTVRNAPSTVTLSREKATRGVGDSYQLTASIPSGTMTTYKWSSSNSSVVSVDKNGKINPKKPGTATITVKTHNGLSASCKVTVRNAPNKVKLSREKATRGVGDLYQLTTSIPSGTMTTYKWSSSNSSVVSVDKNGKINPKKPGTATIKVKTHNGLSASCKVTVRNAPSTVTLSREKATRGVGDSYQLTASIPSGTMTTYKWSSSEPSVVSVDKNGKITPLTAGSAIITASTHNGLSASCKVTVRNAPSTVTLNRSQATIGVGDSYQLTASIPSGTMTTYKWSSSNSSVASVDKNGKITPKKTGTATVTVKTHNGVSASCKVTVRNAPNSVKLNTLSVTKKAGKTYKLTASIPTGTTTTYKWSSSNPSVASVDKNGVVTAIKAGTADITVKTHNGKKAICRVTVINKLSGNISEYEKRVAELVNEIRLDYGLAPLTLNKELSNIAHIKTDDMKTNNYCEHVSPTYGSPSEMIDDFDLNYSAMGENIAYGYTTPEAVVNAWMNSPGHRANILTPYFTQIGVGYTSGVNYWAQMFIG